VTPSLGTDAGSEASVGEAYRATVRRKLGFIAATGVVLLAIAIVAVTTGPIETTAGEVWRVLLGGGTTIQSRVVWHIRLPRVVAAVGAGVGLSVAGAVIQSVLRNPLASPYTLGISQGAAFGAAFSIVVLGTGTTKDAGTIVQVTNPYLTTISAFVASLASTFVILGVAKLKRVTPETMILTGIALAALFTAGTATLEYFATNTELATLVFWKFGDVGVATWRVDAVLWLVVVPTSLYFLRRAWDYNVLDAGDETARSLGVDVGRVRLVGMLVASLVTATVVSFFGIIGFVGLVVPHIVRRAIGGDERFLLPASWGAGGALLLGADTLARTLLSPIVLPVGIVTSFVGVPLFVYLILRGRSYW
jgi:iron complex transport system permease protein